MKYIIVQNIGGSWSTQETPDVKAWAEAAGVKVTGTLERKGARAELQGEPVLQGFAGPMWDGGKVRYEDWKAYDRLSR